MSLLTETEALLKALRDLESARWEYEQTQKAFESAKTEYEEASNMVSSLRGHLEHTVKIAQEVDHSE